MPALSHLASSQDDLLNLFYDEYVHQLAGPIAGKLQAGTAPMQNGENGEDEDVDLAIGCDGVLSTQQHVCELLCFCVQARAAARPLRARPPARPPAHWSADEQNS